LGQQPQPIYVRRKSILQPSNIVRSIPLPADVLAIILLSLLSTVAPVVKVPNQLLGAPLGTNVSLECHVEAFPNTINYWVKNRGEMLLDG